MKKFSMRVVLIISVLFIAFGSANVSIAQEKGHNE
ncbi:putative secreted protein [Listeria monocytogenes SLCC2755]|nr:putative secreted protein [Listeria monocytogenes SLCC2755]